jgi:hypothetical protein
MSYEQRDNSGSLFKNQKKDKDTHPDYTGNGMIDGKGFWFSAWIKKDRNGNTFMSLSFKPKEEMVSTGKHSYSPGGKVKREDPISTGRPRNDDMDDSIPFAPEFR